MHPFYFKTVKGFGYASVIVKYCPLTFFHKYVNTNLIQQPHHSPFCDLIGTHYVFMIVIKSYLEHHGNYFFLPCVRWFVFVLRVQYYTFICIYVMQLKETQSQNNQLSLVSFFYSLPIAAHKIFFFSFQFDLASCTSSPLASNQSSRSCLLLLLSFTSSSAMCHLAQ